MLPEPFWLVNTGSRFCVTRVFVLFVYGASLATATLMSSGEENVAGVGHVPARIRGAGGTADVNLDVHVVRACRVPAGIDRRERSEATAVGGLQPAQEQARGGVGIVAERVGLPDVDRRVRHGLTGVDVLHGESQQQRQSLFAVGDIGTDRGRGVVVGPLLLLRGERRTRRCCIGRRRRRRRRCRRCQRCRNGRGRGALRRASTRRDECSERDAAEGAECQPSCDPFRRCRGRRQWVLRRSCRRSSHASSEPTPHILGAS